MSIFPYCVILAFVFFSVLNINVIATRRRTGIPVGDANDESLLRARSMYSNFHEFASMFLLIFATAEFLGGAKSVLYACAAIFFTGRLIHPYAIAKKQGVLRIVAIALSHTANSLLVIIIALELI